MVNASSQPESSSRDNSAPKERHHTKTHHKHASGSGESKPHRERGPKAGEGVTEGNADTKAVHHTTHHTTQHRPHAPRRSATYDRHDRTHERPHHDREHDGKGSEEPHKRFSMTKILATPFFLLGGALSAAGGVLFGVGSMVKGFGRGKE